MNERPGGNRGHTPTGEHSRVRDPNGEAVLRRTLSGSARGVPPVPPPRHRPSPLIMLAIATLVVATAVALIGHRPPVRTLPHEVQGTWVTSDSRYASRALVLGAHTIAYKTALAANSMQSHLILSVQRSTGPEGERFDVEYTSGATTGEATELSFIFNPGPPAAVTLAHQREIVWRRVPGV